MLKHTNKKKKHQWKKDKRKRNRGKNRRERKLPQRIKTPTWDRKFQKVRSEPEKKGSPKTGELKSAKNDR